ncbi:hypothetical protein Scep_018934 [Stephania cephalantha]|uniref:Uncharacterized protein n=1 Tax=Stephania cephalantha TaxID=152367 RepID=A0AAP0NMR6_9MAGN
MARGGFKQWRRRSRCTRASRAAMRQRRSRERGRVARSKVADGAREVGGGGDRTSGSVAVRRELMAATWTPARAGRGARRGSNDAGNGDRSSAAARTAREAGRISDGDIAAISGERSAAECSGVTALAAPRNATTQLDSGDDARTRAGARYWRSIGCDFDEIATTDVGDLGGARLVAEEPELVAEEPDLRVRWGYGLGLGRESGVGCANRDASDILRFAFLDEISEEPTRRGGARLVAEEPDLRVRWGYGTWAEDVYVFRVIGEAYTSIYIEDHSEGMEKIGDFLERFDDSPHSFVR